MKVTINVYPHLGFKGEDCIDELFEQFAHFEQRSEWETEIVVTWNKLDWDDPRIMHSDKCLERQANEQSL